MATINGTSGNDTLTGTDGDDAIRGLEGDDILRGGAGNDLIDGGDGADSLYGGEGNDTLAFGLGADTLDGGNGDDRFVVNAVGFTSPAPPFGTIAGGDGYDIIDARGVSPTTAIFFSNTNVRFSAGNQNFQVSGVESFYFGFGNDFITGTSEFSSIISIYVGDGNDYVQANPGTSVFGEAGDDSFFLGPQSSSSPSSTVDGGSGVDLISVGISQTVNLQNGTVTNWDGWTWNVANIENVQAYVSSGFDSSVIGDDRSNRITANGRSDLAGRATFSGGGGDDTLIGESNADTLSGDEGDDVLDGGAGDDVLRGGSGNDLLSGGEGADRLEGGSGDDVYYTTAGDTVLELENEGLDIVYSAGSHQLSANVEAAYLLGTGDYIGRGNSLSNYIYGGAGSDGLLGLDGDDLLDGGAGNDWLEGGVGSDWLRGGSGNDTLDGGEGVDAMVGGLGDDIYLVDNIGDVVTEAASSGIDIVRTALDGFILPAEVEGIELQGSANLKVYGRGANDYLYGNSGNNTLFGDAGNDLLDGGAGDDVFSGGAGDDWLRDTGGGADQFVFTGAWGNDTIQGFTAGPGVGDTIFFEKGMFANVDAIVAAWSDVDGNVVINAGNGNTVTILGVTTAQLAGDDFWIF